MVRRSILSRTICIILIAAFSFENVLWANPEVVKKNLSSNTLQVPSPFQALRTEANNKVLEVTLKFLVQVIPDLDEFNYRLMPTIAGINLIIEFDQKYREGGNFIIPCSLMTGRSVRLYEGIIWPDKSISLRKPGKKEGSASRDNDAILLERFEDGFSFLSGPEREELINDLLEFDQRGRGYALEESLSYQYLKAAFNSDSSKSFTNALMTLNDAISYGRETILDQYNDSKAEESINLVNLPHVRIISEMLYFIVGNSKDKREKLEVYLDLAPETSKTHQVKIEQLVKEIRNNWGIGEIFEAVTEYAPIYSEGGLGTVMSQYPDVASKKGLDIKVLLPLYWFDKDGRKIREKVILKYKVRYTGKSVTFKVDNREIIVKIYNAFINGHVLVFYDHALGDSVYIKHKGRDVTGKDHALRRIFMARSLLETINVFKKNPKFIVANDDWTSLMHFYGNEHARYKSNPRIKNAIHITRWHNPADDYICKVPYVTEQGENLFELIVEDVVILGNGKKSWEIQQAFRYPGDPDKISFGAIAARYSYNLGASEGLAEAMRKLEGRTGHHSIFGDPESRPLVGIDEEISQVDFQKELFGEEFVKLLNEWRVCNDPAEKEKLKVKLLKIVKVHKNLSKSLILPMYFPSLFRKEDHKISRAAMIKRSSRIPVVLSIGRIVKQKGLQYLTYTLPKYENTVLEELIIEFPNVKFIFAGPPGDYVGSEVHKTLLNIQKRWPHNVFLRGSVRYKTDEWLTFFRGSDIIIMPSEAEPRGIVPLEGETAGASVVGPNLEGLVTGIIDFNEHPDVGNGFKYDVTFNDSYQIDPQSAAQGLYDSTRNALQVFNAENNPGDNRELDNLLFNCITTDHRWEPKVQEYIEYFRDLRKATALKSRSTEGTMWRVSLFQNLSDPKQLTDDWKEKIFSAWLSGKKIGIFFNRNLKGHNAMLIEGMEDWKKRMKREYPKLNKLFDSLMIGDYDTEEELSDKLNNYGLDLGDEEHNFIFTFDPDPNDENERVEYTGKAMRQVYIKENAHGEFSTEQYYYPLLDIVTISITKELLGYTVDDIYSIFKSVGMDRDKLKDTMNIANIAYDVSCDFLVFTIIPIAKAYEHDSRVSRRVRTLCFLRAA